MNFCCPWNHQQTFRFLLMIHLNCFNIRNKVWRRSLKGMIKNHVLISTSNSIIDLFSSLWWIFLEKELTAQLFQQRNSITNIWQSRKFNRTPPLMVTYFSITSMKVFSLIKVRTVSLSSLRITDYINFGFRLPLCFRKLINERIN